jgi:hypothetical protein
LQYHIVENRKVLLRRFALNAAQLAGRFRVLERPYRACDEAGHAFEFSCVKPHRVVPRRAFNDTTAAGDCIL